MKYVNVDNNKNAYDKTASAIRKDDQLVIRIYFFVEIKLFWALVV